MSPVPAPPDGPVGASDGSEFTLAGLGPSLRRAWTGYQRRLDTAMAEAGFGDRKFPDGRALRLSANPSGSTISAIGRELGITRQGASKVVGDLWHRGYVTVANSEVSKREKSVMLTTRGTAYLQAQRVAARAIEEELYERLGDVASSGLAALLAALDDQEEVRLRTYLGKSKST